MVFCNSQTSRSDISTPRLIRTSVRRRQTLEEHFRQINRVADVEPGGAGIAFPSQMLQVSSRTAASLRESTRARRRWVSTKETNSIRRASKKEIQESGVGEKSCLARVPIDIESDHAEVVPRFSPNVSARPVVHSWPALNLPTCSPRNTFQVIPKT